MQLYPAILTHSVETLTKELEVVRAYPQFSTIHLDIVDGFFADNLTITPMDLVDINFEGLEIVFHMMVNEPLDFVYEAISVKDRLPIKAMVAHIEHMSNQYAYVEEVKRHGWQVGMCLDLHTPLESIDDETWDQLDILQLMSTEAGFQGKQFSPLIFPKITETLAKLKSLNITPEVSVNGGIGLAQIDQLKAAQVSSVVVGSDIWGASDPRSSIEALVQKVQE